MLQCDIPGKHLQSQLIEWESCEALISLLCMGIKMSTEKEWQAFPVPLDPVTVPQTRMLPPGINRV